MADNQIVFQCALYTETIGDYRLFVEYNIHDKLGGGGWVYSLKLGKEVIARKRFFTSAERAKTAVEQVYKRIAKKAGLIPRALNWIRSDIHKNEISGLQLWVTFEVNWHYRILDSNGKVHSFRYELESKQHAKAVGLLALEELHDRLAKKGSLD